MPAQIGLLRGEGEILASEYGFNVFCLTSANFDGNHAVWRQMLGGSGSDGAIGVKAIITAVEGQMWVMVADFDF